MSKRSIPNVDWANQLESVIRVKSKLLCKFPFDRQHGPDDLTYSR